MLSAPTAWQRPLVSVASPVSVGLQPRKRGVAAASSQGGRDPSGRAVAALQSFGLLAFVGSAARRAGGAGGAARKSKVAMRGRNYETNIAPKKGPAEARQAKITGKYLRQIAQACKAGGPDPDVNNQLRRYVDMAIKSQVPKATVERHLKLHKEGKLVSDEVRIEGYVFGASFIIDLTTNSIPKCRTDIGKIFKVFNGEGSGKDGTATMNFKKEGVIRFDGADEDTVMEASLEADVEDCAATEDGSAVEVITTPENFQAALEAFDNQGLKPDHAETLDRPLVSMNLKGEKAYEMLRAIRMLENYEDTSEVIHNAIIEDGVELVIDSNGLVKTWEWVCKNPDQAKNILEKAKQG